MCRGACLFLLLLAGAAAAQDMPLSQVLLPGETWRPVAGMEGTPGAIVSDPSGNLYIADAEKPVIRRLGTDGRVSAFAKCSGIARGLCVGKDGALIAAIPEKERIVALDRGTEGAVLAEAAAQDVVMSPAGQVYYTAGNAVHRVGAKAEVARGVSGPGGLVLWADGGTLVVGEAKGQHLLAFRVKKDGTLDARERYYPLRTRPGQPSSVRALTIDAAGRLYAATKEGVQLFDPTGRLSGVLPPPARAPVTAIAFAGEGQDRLFVVCDGNLYNRKTKARGATPRSSKP